MIGKGAFGEVRLVQKVLGLLLLLLKIIAIVIIISIILSPYVICIPVLSVMPRSTLATCTR